MIIVYPFRHTDDNGRELKYSIRSMLQHGPVTGVCVIGDKPDWYTGEHIPANDIPGRKEWSIVSKVLKVPYDIFMLCSDDVFALQPFTENMPLYYSMPLKQVRRSGRYADRVENTKRCYPNGLMYDIHTPMVIQQEMYHVSHNVDWDKREYLNKSMYANMIGGGVQLPDCKIRNGNIIPDLPFFSTNDRTSLHVPLETMYPVKSEYETP